CSWYNLSPSTAGRLGGSKSKTSTSKRKRVRPRATGTSSNNHSQRPGCFRLGLVDAPRGPRGGFIEKKSLPRPRRLRDFRGAKYPRNLSKSSLGEALFRPLPDPNKAISGASVVNLVRHIAYVEAGTRLASGCLWFGR